MTPFRRFIRLGSKVLASPQFTKKADANEWYRQMLKKKSASRRGLEYRGKTTFIEYARTWMDHRQANYPASTWKADEQRLRDYVLPYWADTPIADLTRQHVHALLKRAAEKKISRQTQMRIKALCSIIFSDAMNEEPPLIEFNPAHGVEMSGSRKGPRKPVFLGDRDECLRFIAAARELGETHLLIAATLLMTGLRKQELIALRWSCVSFDTGNITVHEKLEQATGAIVRGTKAGEEVERVVPVPAELMALLQGHWTRNKPLFDEAFVLTGNVHHMHPRKVSRMVADICERAKLKVTVHGLRHTYGREFVLNTGNVKALQAILGHSSSSTTDIYSNLAGERVKGFGEAVSFDTGVKGR